MMGCVWASVAVFGLSRACSRPDYFCSGKRARVAGSWRNLALEKSSGHNRVLHPLHRGALDAPNALHAAQGGSPTRPPRAQHTRRPTHKLQHIQPATAAQHSTAQAQHSTAPHAVDNMFRTKLSTRRAGTKTSRTTQRLPHRARRVIPTPQRQEQETQCVISRYASSVATLALTHALLAPRLAAPCGAQARTRWGTWTLRRRRPC